MRVDRGAGCVNRPVRPVGVPDSKYRAGLTAANNLEVLRIFAEVNGALSRIYCS